MGTKPNWRAWILKSSSKSEENGFEKKNEDGEGISTNPSKRTPEWVKYQSIIDSNGMLLFLRRQMCQRGFILQSLQKSVYSHIVT